MQMTFDVRQPHQEPQAPPAPSHPWILGLIAVEDGTRAMPEGRPYSFLSDCECPNDCLRDHDSE